MELPLIVGVDGSDASLAALDWAVDEAGRRGLPVRLVYASLWERYEGATLGGDVGRPGERVYAENVVGTAAHRAQLRRPDVPLTTSVLPEEPSSALLHASEQAAAVVTGSRGRGALAGTLLGSVGLTVAARAQCPVIVVRGDKEGVAGTHGRILLGVGDPEHSSQAIEFAFREATVRDCVLDAVRAWRCPAHEYADVPASAGEAEREHRRRATELLDEALSDTASAHPDVRVRRDTIEGPARTTLLRRTAAADLVIIGARHRHTHFGLQLGRVGHALLHHAQCPVAVIPQTT
ncbi:MULTISPECIES: universal stress protein [unclassified Streptomyces]|uniref:universal stress protein n=1 Tax=unclassified Streptomyces TaxID=2593676 RepID=UPI00278BAE6D|nr:MULTISPECIES: universal stress protein [unclassified Streptomyces]